jgi:hypothetical protein
MTAISYQVTGVVTDAGISAAIAAGRTGPKIDIAGFRIGSLSAAEGAVALVTDTDVDGFVYAGDLSKITYSQVDMDTVVWRITLGTDIGNFDVGNIGLVTSSGAMFCKAVLPGKSNKYASSPPQVLGNRKVFNIVMRLDNSGNLLNLSIIDSTECSLPEVPTELDLPDPLLTPWNAYLVDNHTHVGSPQIAVRVNALWWFAPHHADPNQGQGILACVPTQFDVSAPVGRFVYLDQSTHKFSPADGAGAFTQALGCRTSDHEITTLGQVSASVVGLTGPLTAGTLYYVDTLLNVGKLTTVALGDPVAVAVSATDVFIYCTGTLNGSSPTAQTVSVGIGLLALIIQGRRKTIKNERQLRIADGKITGILARLRAHGIN